MKSIFRYPGGKTKSSIQKWIIAHLPGGITEYREPFVGGGGVFFGMHTPGVATPFERVWLNDKHEGLIEVYRALRDRPEEFIEKCKEIESPKEDDPLTDPGPRGGEPKNARLSQVFDELKLNKDCDQALRYFFVNRTVHGSGRVNYDIPSRLYFSNPAGWNIVNNGQLPDAASVLKGVDLTASDYETLLLEPGENVWIYCDPPYVVNTHLSRTSQIYQHSFTMDDHKRFAEVVRQSPHKICISYDDDQQGFVRSLFEGPEFHIIDGASWKYAGTTSAEKEIGKELLILNYEPPSQLLIPAPESCEISDDLTEIEVAELEEIEARIESAMVSTRDSFVEIGLSLAAMRDSGLPSKRLYRTEFSTFQEYCQKRWGFTPQRAGQFMKSASTYTKLKIENKFSILPGRERHLAELGRCESDEQSVEVWQAALEEVGGDINQVTAKLIKKHVDEATGYEPPDPDYFKRLVSAWKKLVSAWKKADEPDRQRFLEQIEQEKSA